jgi:hypothetical protein
MYEVLADEKCYWKFDKLYSEPILVVCGKWQEKASEVFGLLPGDRFSEKAKEFDYCPFCGEFIKPLGVINILKDSAEHALKELIELKRIAENTHPDFYRNETLARINYSIKNLKSALHEVFPKRF